MKLYSLLIGIDTYPTRPLKQCVSDVEKVKKYLCTLEGKFDDVKDTIITLTNVEATRENVIGTIRSHFQKATDTDVVLLYYSGHGALEQTAGVFPEEQDGALECLVCHDTTSLGTDQMIADKELRYILHQLPTNPHIVTIIDACHSGDIVRAFHGDMQDESEDAIRRITGTFPPRKYEQFIFAGDASVEKMIDGKREVFIPFKNHVHLGACLSSESSWEDSKGGVFTRYLLSLLETTQGNLTYNDIARWAKISMKKVTKKQQTPIITVQGEGEMSADSSWLNLNPNGVSFPSGIVTNNVAQGWVYSRGALLGVEKGMEVLVQVEDGEQVAMPVSSVAPDHAVLEMPSSVLNVIDFDKTYPAHTEKSTFDVLRVAINAIEASDLEVAATQAAVRQCENVELVANDARVAITLFNGFAYLTLPEEDFRPLAKQLSLDDPNLAALVKGQLKTFAKWHHFYSLDNPAEDYDTSPIKVTVTPEDGSLVDATNRTCRLIPKENRSTGGLQFQRMKIEVTNVSKEKLFIGVLALNSDFSITSKPFDGIVIELEPGKTKVFYDHKDVAMARVFFDAYKEIYNWKEEWFYYKFIYNNFEDFTSALQDGNYLDPGLDEPLTIDTSTKGLAHTIMRGEGGDVEEVREKWGTCITRIELANGAYNVISGDLESLWPEYADSAELAPFIKELYFDDLAKINGDGQAALEIRHNKNQSAVEATRATSNVLVQFLNRLYNRSRRRKFRRQRHKDGPIVVAEGDSWFLFPKPGVRDTLDYIMDDYRLLSLADAGDEIADYIKNRELLTEVARLKPEYVLISGGGNDVVGEGIKELLNPDHKQSSAVKDYLLTDKLENKMTFLQEGYKMFFNKIRELQPEVRILIHGYDYIREDLDERTIQKGWANRYMIEAGIHDATFRHGIVMYLVDNFNELLKGFEHEFSWVTYVDNRNTIGANEWMDEIHPNNVGYHKVAQNFLRALSKS